MLSMSPDTLAAAYEYLRTTPPFKRWKLPPSDEISFTVNHHKYWYGSHQGGPTCNITLSNATIGHTSTLIRVMAHEMIHLRQYLHGEETRTDHNRDFRKKADMVCRAHGFDLRSFV